MSYNLVVRVLVALMVLAIVLASIALTLGYITDRPMLLPFCTIMVCGFGLTHAATRPLKDKPKPKQRPKQGRFNG